MTSDENIREKLIDIIVSADISLFGTGKPYAEVYADHLIAEGVTIQEWKPVSDPPKKSGRYLIYTTKYFVPDHVGDPDHVDGMEISGYHPQFGFLSDNGLHAKYWSYLPTEPKEAPTNVK